LLTIHKFAEVKNTLKIALDLNQDCALDAKEATYIFETLCITLGVSWQIIKVKGINHSDIDIYYGNTTTINAKIIIIANKLENLQAKPNLIKKNEHVFFQFTGKLLNEIVLKDRRGNTHISNDIIYTLFYLLTGKDESNIERNRWDQHDIKQSVLYQNDLLHKPLFNNYVNMLHGFLRDSVYFIPKWEKGKKAALALSHDTDYPEIIRSIEIIRYLLKNKGKSKFQKVLGIANGSEHFWKFEDYVRLEKLYGAKSAFYFCPIHSSLIRYFLSAPDPFYNTSKKKFRDISMKLVESGFEVGLHSSYFAYKSLTSFKREKNKLQKDFNNPILGNRHHYWHMNPENPSNTWDIHEQSGLFYDTSLSFEQHSGFRYSICTPFKPWHQKTSRVIDLYQIPPSLMDDHLFGYDNLNSFNNYQEQIESLSDSILENEGVLVADFHVRVLNNTFFPEWGTAYEYLLKTVTRNNDFQIDTPLNICKHWDQREQLIRKNSRNEYYPAN
jgi:hypothetical protein